MQNDKKRYKRLFIAITPEEKIKSCLLKSISEYKKEQWASNVKWISPENIHLTLKFIGNFEKAKIDSLSSAIESKVKGFGSFTAELSGIRLFPKPSRPSVISASAHSPFFEKLACLIDNSVSTFNIPIEKKKFRAHFTLGRIKKKLPGHIVIENRIAEKKFHVSSIELYRSILSSSGAKYFSERKFSLN